VNVENPFVGRRLAERYAQARPGLHGHAIDLVIARHGNVERAIDVACGTGLSTTPLQAIAREVVGADLSWDMLATAPREKGVSYVQARAERLPFDDGSFDLATVCSAIHWFDRDAVSELHRILDDEGALVVYDVWFPARMVDQPGFSTWMDEECGPRYPGVPKNRGNIKALEGVGFRQAWEADERFEVQMDLGALVGCLMTHSERIAAIRDGRESEGEQVRFFTEGLRPFFREDDRHAVEFGIRLQAFERE
jgi:ubiquinone/menaquinone biosynthesis C-methylase UbiE